MLSGVWTAHDSAMTRNVTHRACARPGSASTARQLSKPAGRMSPSPSQEVKLSARTPSSGMTPNATKKTRAGSTSHANDPPCAIGEVLAVRPLAAGGGGASAVTVR